MVLKQDGSKMPFEPTDFRVGLDIGICGRSIRVYDCDKYTREFFDVSFRYGFLFDIFVNFNFSSIESRTITE